MENRCWSRAGKLTRLYSTSPYKVGCICLCWGGGQSVFFSRQQPSWIVLATPGSMTMVARWILEFPGCWPSSKWASTTLWVLHPALPVPLGWQSKKPQLFESSGDSKGNLLECFLLSLEDKLKHSIKEREWGCKKGQGDLHAAAVWS